METLQAVASGIGWVVLVAVPGLATYLAVMTAGKLVEPIFLKAESGRNRMITDAAEMRADAYRKGIRDAAWVVRDHANAASFPGLSVALHSLAEVVEGGGYDGDVRISLSTILADHAKPESARNP